MISHVTVCLLAHGEKSSISSIFCHAKREYSLSVRPIGCTPIYLILEQVAVFSTPSLKSDLIILSSPYQQDFLLLPVLYEDVTP